MNSNIRLNLIYNVASIAYHSPDHAKYDLIELIWIIGMLSDVRVSDDEILKEIEKLKKNFPEYVAMLTFEEK